MKLEQFVIDNGFTLVYTEDRKTVMIVNRLVGSFESSESKWSCELKNIPYFQTVQDIRVQGVRLVDHTTFGHPSRGIARQKVIDAIKGKFIEVAKDREIFVLEDLQ